MKRDMDLMRRIMFRVEEADDIVMVRDLDDLEGYDISTVARHVEWLAEAGLIKVEYLITGTKETALDGIIIRQTWKGCEFLDAARDENVWETTKSIVIQSVRTVSFETFQTLLIEIGKTNIFPIQTPQ